MSTIFDMGRLNLPRRNDYAVIVHPDLHDKIVECLGVPLKQMGPIGNNRFVDVIKSEFIPEGDAYIINRQALTCGAAQLNLTDRFNYVRLLNMGPPKKWYKRLWWWIRRTHRELLLEMRELLARAEDKDGL